MPNQHPSLMRQKRFLPYFITQFFGAFNDNIFKNVLLLFVAFAGAEALPISSNLFINLAAGLFILPFFLFSASAGVLADKYEKSAYIRKVKLAEIGIMTLGAIGFVTQSYLILLILLFLMGTQSAFFGPVKYALLPQHLKRDELVSGNALVETGTFLAILLGTLGAGVIASADNATIVAAICVVSFALCGYVASRSIPEAAPTAPDVEFKWRPVSQTKHTLAIAKRDRVVFQAIMAISWFWFLGASYLTQFPNYTKLHLNGNESAVSFLLALFSVGIAIGSMACDRISKHKLEPGIVPVGSLGISVFGIMMASFTPDSLPEFADFTSFLTYPALWPVFFSLLMLGASGGLFIVPLYTLMQTQAREDERAQIIAANNIYNSIYMVGSAVLGIVCLSVLELSIPTLFLLLAIVNIFVAIYVYWQAPMFFSRIVLWMFTHTMYRVKHKNLDNIPKEGGALIVCNHVSYMDALLMIGACKRQIRFVMEEEYAHFKPIKTLLENGGVIAIDGTNSRSVRQAFTQVKEALSKGEVVCIFPEGRLTNDGDMNPFMRGMDLILRRSPVPVIPMALKGLWGSYFSRSKDGRACHGFPRRFWSRVEIEAGTPVQPDNASTEYMFEQVSALRGDWK
ncbi:putative Permease of the major facilitator superfamily fused with 1-acyl-sn-glycerol-3-phosphate acyltransferase [Vibrio nigripulchritudo SFn27]|uniref:Putative Permease of the major facilitator superfamily fused with 1-acyl-sn-glycerol-3-phosphate acyltransferase n=1 Tax=Vibrio nigripulchritudo TaxID=28173 RepID=U4JZP8_9VIBR|nr:MFS transporter [Vibrio nigripulchritudo]CCN84905.1 putative Permease of the major facilitator superfamily fused with 1-acyl-sn-glycerol-3-phosphate acyltransferase [Vibrio nigripulchritudo BLFn1]CCN90117.1 putative Permease of the major facilitator superfamily fused with 1-acyl-sn-glycerol-3-phosphate acyltransferase [Vibrio nigripulchritudo SFn27]CCN94270.1 putative Permease of the major facilitator superfamily fused with 1-acyl-sn-glycerol-3-phosphate acyltransferase [Vibrio nigripulchritu